MLMDPLQDRSDQPQPLGSEQPSAEPFCVHLSNAVMDPQLQQFISSFVDYIASVLEPPESAEMRHVAFMPERGGILLFGFRPSTVQVIYRFLAKIDEERHNIRFEINLVYVESHKMTNAFEF
eukprot:gnl/Spiro4/1472_TR789_c0_g1_i1.p1 gnl/Spiro4/1472_TR789_c0_g1~~gnl/Spiro4/1472_TR789_c0_g1_i1.p1  ORF type:complete len:122 (+),score=20.53 gnl/Spiro4/1472_TR789_c0_g1_i1:98-463(+)